MRQQVGQKRRLGDAMLFAAPSTQAPKQQQQQQSPAKKLRRTVAKKSVSFAPVVIEYSDAACQNNNCDNSSTDTKTTATTPSSTWYSTMDLHRCRHDVIRTVQIYSKHNGDISQYEDICLRGLEGHLTALVCKDSKKRRLRHRHNVLQAQRQLYMMFDVSADASAEMLGRVSHQSSEQSRLTALKRGFLDTRGSSILF